MSKWKKIVESILTDYKQKHLIEAESVVYRTYADEPYLNDITGNHANKPAGGLWGCRDDSWKNWCTDEDFTCADNYFEWTLKPNAKVYTIDNVDDFIYLLKNYYIPESYYIDFVKLSKEYDAVELTDKGNRALHYSLETKDPELQDPKYKYTLLMALNSWDIPSICVFHPKETVQLLD